MVVACMEEEELKKRREEEEEGEGEGKREEVVDVEVVEEEVEIVRRAEGRVECREERKELHAATGEEEVN